MEVLTSRRFEALCVSVLSVPLCCNYRPKPFGCRKRADKRYNPTPRRCWMERRLGFASLVAVAFAAVLGLTAGLGAQEKHSPTLLTTDHYMDLERVSDAQIAPDGSRIIYTRQH